MANKMPREIAPGVFWIGDCLAQRHKGKVYHGYNAAFLVAGKTASCLVETGHPKDFPVIERHMNELFAQGVAPLKYLFVTHQETCIAAALVASSRRSLMRPCAETSATITLRSRNTNTACSG